MSGPQFCYSQRKDGREHDRVEKSDRKNGDCSKVAVARINDPKTRRAAPTPAHIKILFAAIRRMAADPMKRPTINSAPVEGDEFCAVLERDAKNVRIREVLYEEATDGYFGSYIDEDRKGTEVKVAVIPRCYLFSTSRPAGRKSWVTSRRGNR